jgi:glutamate synthase domain-containing protein 2/glutamate synthase domain-containing protein 3/glutamate synthase domain-containing protein 1
MLDIPFELFGFEPGSVAVATIFAPRDEVQAQIAFEVFEKTFAVFGLEVTGYREVPIVVDVLGPQARESLPRIRQAFIKRPAFIHSDEAFNTLLYRARQMTRTKEREAGIYKQFFFASLSSTTIIYKGLTRGEDLPRFYPDLVDSRFISRFGLFHRRFSTNTKTSWDKAQPFRLIAHNGEINTIEGNRAWAYSREQALGLQVDELLTHDGTSDSGNMNEMVEALTYRSSIPYLGDVLSIMIPPAHLPNALHQLWSRAMEPWDGPAFVAYCDDQSIGARLDRNGFRPCRWATTDERFYLASEAGSFPIDQNTIRDRGTVMAGSGVSVSLATGDVDLHDSSRTIARRGVSVDPRLIPLSAQEEASQEKVELRQPIFGYTHEDLSMMLVPMAAQGKEPIGSMGNTARMAVLSDQPRSVYDFFYQHFAQVTNPPVDYIRERIVTDLTMYLGRMPNVFSPKELIPPFPGIYLDSPILSLAQMNELAGLEHIPPFRSRLSMYRLDGTFRNSSLKERLADLGEEAIAAARKGYTILCLSDRKASLDSPPIPSLLGLSSIVRALDACGQRLKVSVIIDGGDVRTAHQVACLLGFGASAVCPYLAISSVRQSSDKALAEFAELERESNLIAALRIGLLRVMSKMGISVARSYHGAQLFSCVGLGDDVREALFPNIEHTGGGLSFASLERHVLSTVREPVEGGKLPNIYQMKEQSKGKEGERHSMTVLQSRLIHRLVREEHSDEDARAIYDEYVSLTESYYPISLRHLLRPLGKENIELSKVEGWRDITKRFGSGAMSFGAISAESQRDIFLAMSEVGGRSNSGEGGENPYYWSEGVHATCKQVASARFGVTGQYLISGNEIQIKIAQGAKPGEGGQLMREKVSADIARARHASEGIDLISPPPLHDIYSIEDLKELIYELRQFHPKAKINVKLVSGANIGTIAVGVVKAGADSIQISGGDGGTGAAATTSMIHAGLPWELGLVEVDHMLTSNGLRELVELRIDGGLSTGRDIVCAAILGAEGFDFGKLLLVAEGCIMARLCHKNTCPVGIATHAERFKKKYRGTKEHVVSLLRWIAEDTRSILASIGETSLANLYRRTDLLEYDDKFSDLVRERGIDLSSLLKSSEQALASKESAYNEGLGQLNHKILSEVENQLPNPVEASYEITATDRAVPATLCGHFAKIRHEFHMASLGKGDTNQGGSDFPSIKVDLQFRGSAGQGFGMLLEEGISTTLIGEANDSVGKSMTGGRIVIKSDTERSGGRSPVLVGNCALYGATGGVLFVSGVAGDRFGVRNSGATAVVEGLGLHGCEYMTSGIVVVLGSVAENFGAGMTGGKAYLRNTDEQKINLEHLCRKPLGDDGHSELKDLLCDFAEATDSPLARAILADWSKRSAEFAMWVPK